MRRIDLFTKVIDGVNQKTFLGAILSIVSFLLVIILLKTEISSYLETDIKNRLIINEQHVGTESVRIIYDVEFYRVKCDKISVSQETTRGSIHTFEGGDLILKDDTAEGCRVHGQIVTDKAGGNFKFDIEIEKFEQPRIQLGPDAFIILGGLNGKIPELSHKIHNLLFLPNDNSKLIPDSYLPGVGQTLNGQETLLPDSLDTGLYVYHMDVVPTMYKPLSPFGKDSLVTNQYSVKETRVGKDQATGGVMVWGQGYRETYGIVFHYDFTPVMLLMEEKKESLFEFLCSLCGLIGGALTILSLVERMLQSSAKAVLGKKD